MAVELPSPAEAKLLRAARGGPARGFRKARLRAAASSEGRPWPERDARLALEDGSIWRGVGFGAGGTRTAELVFNTTLTGYQEVMTDPSYAGQFVLFTQPHIGNVGVNEGDDESTKCHLGGVVVRELSPVVSNYRSQRDLHDYLEEQGVIGIHDVDTRSITRRIRESGCLVGVVTTDSSRPDSDLLKEAQDWSILGKDLVSTVTCPEPYEWVNETEEEWEFSSSAKSRVGERLRVVVYDFGVKSNILRRLRSYGCEIKVVPADYPANEVLKMSPDGVLFSNGPGDPSAVPYAVESAQQLIGHLPTFGICMGHQVMSQALGARTFKLKFGHHGGNHPVRHVPTGRVEISSQNHNYAVDPDDLPGGVEVTHVNLNDGTCAGMKFAEKQAMAIQYHPEASPGPHDADVSFLEFVRMMRENRQRMASSPA